jgi:hypothetical protein
VRDDEFRERVATLEATVGIDGEWRGMEVRALDGETAVIDGDGVSGTEVQAEDLGVQ